MCLSIKILWCHFFIFIYLFLSHSFKIQSKSLYKVMNEWQLCWQSLDVQSAKTDSGDQFEFAFVTVEAAWNT